MFSNKAFPMHFYEQANTVYQHHTLGVDIKVVVVKLNFLTKRQVGHLVL